MGPARCRAGAVFYLWPSLWPLHYALGLSGWVVFATLIVIGCISPLAT